MALTKIDDRGLKTPIDLLDNEKIRLGTGNDLELYHNGTDNIFDCKNDKNLKIVNDVGGGNETMALFDTNGAVELYHNNIKTFQTSTNGVQVFGPEGGNATQYFYADEGDDNADEWGLIAHSSSSKFSIDNYAGGGWETSLTCEGNGAVKLFYDDSKKFETTANGVTITGNDTGTLIQGDVSFYDSANSGYNMSWDQSTPQLKLYDPAKLVFGNGNDLEIYHNGTDNFIKNVNGEFKLLMGSEYAIKATANGAVELYHNDVKKFETLTDGIQVEDDSAPEIRLLRTGNSGYAKVYGNASNQLFLSADHTSAGADTKISFMIDGSEKAQLNPDGSLLIGTNNTDSLSAGGVKIQTSSVAGESKALNIRNPDTGSSSAVSMIWNLDRSTGGIHFEAGKIKVVKEQNWTTTASTVDSTMEFYTTKDETSAERMRINSSGRVCIGTTNDDGGGAANTDNGVVIKEDGQVICRRDDVMYTAKSLATGGYTAFRTLSAQTQVGSITFNSGGTAFNTSSDYRRKENIVNLTDGITRLKTLKPYRFNFKDESDVTRDGFLAHEVTTVPEAVWGTKDAVEPEDDEDKGVKKDDPIYQQLDQSKLVPLLTAALQEAITKIETLETKVAALEAA